MARPVKQGIEYFAFDTDFFQDIKVRKIIRACGPASAAILASLLCNIYRDKGYYIGWDEDMAFVVADEVGTTEGAVGAVVDKALSVGFFDKALFDKEKILTSKGIQERFKSATTRREKIIFVDNYLVSACNNSISVDNNPQDVDNNPKNANKNPVSVDGSTQSKVNIKNNIPPISPLQGECEWKKSFELYKKLVRGAYREIERDKETLKKQQSFYPGVDILKSVEKACVNYWATEAGWNNKKKSRKNIDMKMTLINAIAKNKVYDETAQVQEKRRYDNGEFLN